jgi:hypothetical protein
LSFKQVVAAIVADWFRCFGQLQIKAEVVVEGWAYDAVDELVAFVSQR